MQVHIWMLRKRATQQSKKNACLSSSVFAKGEHVWWDSTVTSWRTTYLSLMDNRWTMEDGEVLRETLIDNGVLYTSNLFQYCLQDIGVQHLLTTPYIFRENPTLKINHTVKTLTAQQYNEEHAMWDRYPQRSLSLWILVRLILQIIHREEVMANQTALPLRVLVRPHLGDDPR